MPPVRPLARSLSRRRPRRGPVLARRFVSHLLRIGGGRCPTDRKIDGKSLLPLLLAGSGDRHHEYVYHAWDRYFPNPDNRWSISDQRWKLACQVARRNGQRQNWQLYDLQDDLGETNNMIIAASGCCRRSAHRVSALVRRRDPWRQYRPVPIPVGHPSEPVAGDPAELGEVARREYPIRLSRLRLGHDRGLERSGRTRDLEIGRPASGRYQVAISYGRSGRDGGRLRLRVGDQSLECDPPSTPTPNVFERIEVGELRLAPGPATSTAEVVDAHGTELLRLNRIFLMLK